MVYWSEKDIINLIQMVKRNPFVWDASSPDYKKKQKKHLFWTATAEALNKLCKPAIEFSRDDCLKKWNNLRTYFHSEHNKAIKSADAVEYATGSWKYSEKMSFLVGSLLPKVSVNTFNNSDISVFDDAANSQFGDSDADMGPDADIEPSGAAVLDADSEVSLSAGATADSLVDSSHSMGAAPTLSCSTPHVQRSKKKTGKDSEYFHYGMYVSRCLEKLDGDLYLDAREGINSILAKNEKQQLLRE